MLVDILIAVIMNLSMYIITSTIVGSNSEQTKNYYKDQIEALEQTIINMTVQQQTNLMNEVKQGHLNVMNEIKEATNNLRKENEN